MIAVWSEDETAICQEVEWKKDGRKSFFNREEGAWERKFSAVQDFSVALDCLVSADDRRDGGREGERERLKKEGNIAQNGKVRDN